MARMKLSSSRSSYSKSKTVKEEYLTVGGPKVDYSKYFVNEAKAPEYYKPNVKTDKEILDDANQRFNQIYDTYIKNSEKERNHNIEVIGGKLSALNPQYKERLDALNESYKLNERSLRNDAMSKGMGRSSYLTDVQSENSRSLSKETNRLNAEKQRIEADLKRDIQKEYLEHENKRDLYAAQKKMDIDKLVADLKRDRDKTLFDAQKYNNELYSNYNKLLLSQRKHNLDVQKYMDKINTKKVTVTTTTRTSKSTSYKAQSGVDRERVEALWNSMSGGQKIKYFKKNSSLLKAGVPDLYGKYAKESSQYAVNTVLSKLKKIIF